MLLVATYAMLGVGALTTIGFMLYAGEPGRLTWWPLFVPFAAWALLPYTVVFREARKRTVALGRPVTLLATASALTAFGALVLYQAFIAYPDPQSGIVLIFIPLYQLIGLVPFFLVLRYLTRRAGQVAGP